MAIDIILVVWVFALGVWVTIKFYLINTRLDILSDMVDDDTLRAWVQRKKQDGGA